jgi:nicotinamidase-related amidase
LDFDRPGPHQKQDLDVTLTLDPRTTALVLIDLQKGIVSRQLEPHTAALVVENGVRLGHRFAELGAPIVPVHVDFSPSQADRLRQPIDAPNPAGDLPADWAELTPEVAALPTEFVITKRQWGAFYGTQLDLQLRRRGITTIVLCGIATNFGVESTAREAWQHNYAVVVAEDACTSMGPGLHAFSIENILPRLARIRSTDEILAALA